MHQSAELNLFLAERKESINRALLIDISEHLIIERTVGRRFCPSCCASYHIVFKKSKVENKCDICGGELIHRSDDWEEIVRERLSLYFEMTRPIINYYEGYGKLSKINGDSEVSNVFNNIYTVLKGA